MEPTLENYRKLINDAFDFPSAIIELTDGERGETFTMYPWKDPKTWKPVLAEILNCKVSDITDQDLNTDT